MPSALRPSLQLGSAQNSAATRTPALPALLARSVSSAGCARLLRGVPRTGPAIVEPIDGIRCAVHRLLHPVEHARTQLPPLLLELVERRRDVVEGVRDVFDLLVSHCLALLCH